MLEYLDKVKEVVSANRKEVVIAGIVVAAAVVTVVVVAAVMNSEAGETIMEGSENVLDQVRETLEQLGSVPAN